MHWKNIVMMMIAFAHRVQKTFLSHPEYPSHAEENSFILSS